MTPGQRKTAPEGKRKSSSPYDDVFRTLLTDCPQLILPIVNEVFREHYFGDEKVILYQNENFVKRDDGTEQKRVTDTYFGIVCGLYVRKFHIECQSTEDGTIIVRIFEYDTQIALRDSEYRNGELYVRFPKSALLALRTPPSEKKESRIHIETPGGNVSYSIPVIKVKDYSVEEIFEKKLYFLIPFHIFVYENMLRRAEKEIAVLEELKSHFQDIVERLNELCSRQEITEYTKRAIMQMSKNSKKGVYNTWVERFWNMKQRLYGGKDMRKVTQKDMHNQ